MTGHTAFLRVYEPLAAFAADERRYWGAYLEQGRAPTPEEGARMERAASVAAGAGPAARVPDLSEHAYVTEVDGVTLVCPWRTRARALEALEDFADGLPDLLLGAYLPLSVAYGASAALDAWRAAHPGARVSQLSSTWQVPLRWFVLVDPSEREVRLGVPAASGARGRPDARVGRALRYRTPMSNARRRTARALAALRRADDPGVPPGRVVLEGLDDLVDTGRWLEEFHPRSLVELDYAGLVHLLDDESLAADDSAADVAQAVRAASEGDRERAAAAQEKVTARMRRMQAVESAN